VRLAEVAVTVTVPPVTVEPESVMPVNLTCAPLMVRTPPTEALGKLIVVFPAEMPLRVSTTVVSKLTVELAFAVTGAEDEAEPVEPVEVFDAEVTD